MQTRSFWGGLAFIAFGFVLVFTGNGYPYGVICIGAGLFAGLIWYFLWSRDQQAIRRNQERRQEAPMVQEQRPAPMSDERSKRIVPPGEL